MKKTGIAKAYDFFVSEDSIVHVTWKDSTSYNGWIDKEKKFDLCVCTTVGFLLNELSDSEKIVVCQSKNVDFVADVIVIPKVNIVEIKQQRI